jgi:biopolymer transport protein ExbD
MSMNVGGSSEEQSVMANINTTPLVDVMLVLLIIFLITIPVINKTVKVDLPKAVNIPTQTKPENITVAVDKEGNIFWNDRRMPTSRKRQCASRSPKSTFAPTATRSSKRWDVSFTQFSAVAWSRWDSSRNPTMAYAAAASFDGGYRGARAPLAVRRSNLTWQ